MHTGFTIDATLFAATATATAAAAAAAAAAATAATTSTASTAATPSGRNVTLLGESFGGLLAMGVAQRLAAGGGPAAEALRGVVLVNPATSFDRTPVRAVLPALTALPPDKIPVPLPKLGNEVSSEVEAGESPSSDAGKWVMGGGQVFAWIHGRTSATCPTVATVATLRANLLNFRPVPFPDQNREGFAGLGLQRRGGHAPRRDGARYSSDHTRRPGGARLGPQPRWIVLKQPAGPGENLGDRHRYAGGGAE